MSRRFYPSRALSIAHKEVRHITRDPFTLAWAFGLPVIMVLFFGYVIDFNVREVRLVAADRDATRASRELLTILRASGYFRLLPPVPGQEIQTGMVQEKTKGVLIIEPGFGKDLGAGRPAQVQVLLDGADNSTSGLILSYLGGIQQAAAARLSGAAARAPLTFSTRYLFNPELNSHWFVIPGLAVVVMGILSIILTALTVAREWETGSMELLLSTPVRPLEIILGKLAPYLGLVLITVGLIYLVARLQFGVPFRGSHLLYLLGVILFLTLCLAQGLLISVAARQQTLAVQLSFIAGLLPALLMSGFIFPIESMPAFFQYLTFVLPPRWFVAMSRGLFLKGAGVFELALPLGMLTMLNLLIVAGALRAFKTDLEPRRAKGRTEGK
ncbi:MAG: ABC transporter permease [candidate division FCPU426 bacterium]